MNNNEGNTQNSPKKKEGDKKEDHRGRRDYEGRLHSVNVDGTRTRTVEGHGSRRSDYGRSSLINSTLVSHALREVVSDHIIAGPHGALLPVSSITSLQFDRGSASGQMLTLSLPDGLEFPVFFEDAVTESGHGCFQYKLMALCGFVYSCCSLSTTTLSFVLPAAQWDFKLTSTDQGVLNTAPMIGMVLGAYIWGNFADSKGRRIFNGFGIIGATSIVFAYLGEFLDFHKRDHYLSRLELFWTFGIITLPVIGFIILPRDWNFRISDNFKYNAWRIFVFACGVPSFIAALLISLMPESPRFLYLQGNYEKTKKVLVRMYVSNTGNRPEDFPVKVFHNTQQEYHFSKLQGAGPLGRVKVIFKAVIKQHKVLLQGRSLLNIMVACFIDFGLMSVYFTFMLWIPELLHRHELWMENHPGEQARLCKVVKEHIEKEASGKVDYETLIHTFIVCMACLPSNIILLCVIEYVSKKLLLIVLLVGAACPTAAVYFMETQFQLTTMLCLFEAVTTLVEAVLFCAIVEMFPLSTRGSALSLTVTIGRLGAIVGNVVFGLNLESHCRELFAGMSGMLVVSGLSALLLPKMAGSEMM